MTHREDAFDRHARRAHAASLDALSPRVQAQLAQRRRAALAATPASGRGLPRWGWAGALAAVGALAIGLQLRAPDPAPAGPAIATASTEALPADPGGVLAEDPDFYLWLASRESQALAME